MKNLKNILTTKRNSPQGLFLQLTVFALLSIMSLIGATATQTFAQTCQPAPGQSVPPAFSGRINLEF